MNGAFHLAWLYVAFNRSKTLLLAGAIAIAAFVPWSLHIVVNRASEALLARSATTPLIIGGRGSALELTLSTLYFRPSAELHLSGSELASIETSRLATVVPIHCRFSARGYPVVGTSLDYLPFRDLTFASGRGFSLLGECVVGSEVAGKLGLQPGDSIVTTPANAFDIAGEYPLKLNITGVLEQSWTPDDEAVFVDIKTAWIIEGLGHGHEDLSTATNSPDILANSGTNVVAGASLFQFREITPDNVATFHFHGDPADFPLTSAILLPSDEKAATLLMGRYVGDDARSQIIVPAKVIDGLMQTVFAVKAFVIVLIVLVGVATIVMCVFVVMLSLRLRRGEFQTLMRIGASRGFVAALPAIEVAIVLVVAFGTAALLAGLTGHYATTLGRLLISTQG